MDEENHIGVVPAIEQINDHGPIDKINEGPVIPTAAELDPSPSIPSSSSEMTPEAPYGYNQDGTPAKKRGRKPKGETGGNSTLPDLDSVTPARPRPVASSQSVKPAVIVADYRALGQQAANLWFNVPQIFLGPDWGPEKEEVPMVAKGFQDYFEANGIQSFSPGLSLAIILGSYSLSKANKPTIRERISGFMGKLKVKLPWKK